ncbi:MAG: hypothetical protein AAF217_09865 [Pseudomonadota bacterium]
MRFWKDTNGNIAIMGGSLALPIVMLLGLGVDYTRVSSQKSVLENTMHNAVYTVKDLFRRGRDAELEIAGMVNSNTGRSTARVNIEIDKNKLRISVSDQVKTPMWSVMGQPETEIMTSVIIDKNRTAGQLATSK